MTQPQPPRPRGAIPTFSDPRTPEPATSTATIDPPANPLPSSSSDRRPPIVTPTTPTPTTANPVTAASLTDRVKRGLRLNQESPRPDTGDTHTPISSTGEKKEPPRLTKGTATKAMIGAVGVLAMVGAFLVNQRYGGRRTLRTPTDAQAAEIAEPAAEILLRHAKMARAVPDLIDGLELIAATGKYLNAGPLTIPRYDAGDMPQGDES